MDKRANIAKSTDEMILRQSLLLLRVTIARPCINSLWEMWRELSQIVVKAVNYGVYHNEQSPKK